MTTTLDRMKTRAKKTWTKTIDGTEHHFRRMTELEKSSVEMIGIRLDKNGQVEADPDPKAHIRKGWQRLVYQWVEADGSPVAKSVDEISQLDPDDVQDLLQAVFDGDPSKQTDKVAEKKSD